MEELVIIQGKYYIPSNEFANKLREESINYILKRYKPFHETYSNVNFSTNKEKYIKYKPEDVAHKLKNIFCEY